MHGYTHAQKSGLKVYVERVRMSVFAHIDPGSGSACLYSPDVQHFLACRLTEHACNAYLGTLCFNATVHKSGGKYWQTTPAIRHVKPAGRREVVRVPRAQTEVALWRTLHSRWVAEEPDNYLERKTEQISSAEHATEWVWQWCRQVYLSTDEADWHTYEATTCSEIEAARAQADGAFAVPITVGIRAYEIRGNRRHSFGKQVDPQHDKVRWVRRVARAQPQAGPADNTCDDCAMCCEPLVAASVTLPTWRPWSCGHGFHSVCIQLVVDAAQPCPLCRCETRR